MHYPLRSRTMIETRDQKVWILGMQGPVPAYMACDTVDGEKEIIDEAQQSKLNFKTHQNLVSQKLFHAFMLSMY